MTEERDAELGDNGESTGDGLDAWLAAHFPDQSAKSTPSESQPGEPQAKSPSSEPALSSEPVWPTPPPPSGPPSSESPSSEPPLSAEPVWPTPPPPSAPGDSPFPTQGAWPPIVHSASEQESPPQFEPPQHQLGQHEPGQYELAEPNQPSTPSVHEPQPTGPVFPPMAEELSGIPPAAELPPPPTEAFADVPGASGIDALFGDTKFREYEEGPSSSENPFTKREPDVVAVPADPSTPRERSQSPQKVLLWVAGSLLAALALLLLFMLGTKLPDIFGPAPGAIVAPSTSPSATPSPSPTVTPIGPVVPGDYLWDELLGGECVNPYEGPWQVEYTVVECGTPHAAQLVTRDEFVLPEGTLGFPGVEALESQVNLLCTAPAVVDYAAASAYTDIQFEASYALSAEDWTNGNNFYNCFLSRSGGGELSGSIAVPQVVPEPSEETAP